MEFLETPIFTKQITKLISDKEYHLLQLQLAVRPESGDIIKGSGGIRKLRWSGSGRGKRGGIRIVYYFINDDEKIYMLFAYPKNVKDDLSSDQLKQLKKLVEEQLS
tara:strand:- start:22495 stop:22812 length:318 start_codon:yes stop_codon:yes gene_type:complete